MPIIRTAMQCQKQSTDAALDRMQGAKEDNGFGDKITKLTDATGKDIKLYQSTKQ